MDQFDSLNSVSNTIAKNLKALRKERKLSLDNVSELTSVSKSMLRQIERRESSPTISTLWKIATGLHVSFTSLLENPHEEVYIIKKTEFSPLLSDGGSYRLYPFFPAEEGRHFEMLYIEMDAGSCSESLPHEPGTEEFVIVYSGTMELVLENETYKLSSGSAIHYKADQKHIYKNPSSSAAHICMVISYKTN